MKRLILCSVVALSLPFLASCSGDPTSSLRNGVAKLNPTPSQVFLQQGKTTNVDVTATDEQGNQIETAFSITNQGAGITVERDPAFRPVFVNDSQLGPPATDAIFRYHVTANNLVSTTFTITAEGKDVVVPVKVVPDPLTTVVPAATVTTAGATAADPTTVSIAPPFVFTPASTVTFDAGSAIITGVAADGSTITFFAPPGTTSTGAITGIALTYLAAANVSTVTDVPLTISATVPSQPGTDDPATAPDVTSTPAFFDGGAFTGADITLDGGSGAQYYKFTVAAQADVTIDLDAQGAAVGTDVDLVLCSDVTCSDGGDFTAAAVGQPEEGVFSLAPGTYYAVVVLFAGTAPSSISLSIAQ